MKQSFASVRRLRRIVTLGAAFAALGGVAGCSDLLEVENPQAVETEQLNSRAYLNLLTTGVVGDFQRAYDDVAMYTGIFTDELRNHATFTEEPLIDQRRVDPDNGTVGGGVYGNLQRTRGLADTAAGIFRSVLGDSAKSDLRYARIQAYGGITYVLLGEVQCEVPVNMSRPYKPEEIFRDFAIPRFEEAIAVATAARTIAAAVNPSTSASRTAVAGADSIINFARVGAARAALDLNDKARAIQFASQVPASFRIDAYYSENSAEENNFVYSRLTGAISTSATGTPFEALRGLDVRVPIPTVQETAVGGLRVYVPNSPTAYSTYSGTQPGAEFTRSASIRIASGLEAQYIVAEATGPNASTIAFVESRRLIAPTGTQPTTAANFFANLRDQRRRDFYLDAHRMGDLRRYQAVYGNSLEDYSRWQQGPYPNVTGVDYGDQYCLPVNRAEVNANPNYR